MAPSSLTRGITSKRREVQKISRRQFSGGALTCGSCERSKLNYFCCCCFSFSVLVANPKKTTLHGGGQSRSWSAEQRKRTLAAKPPPSLKQLVRRKWLDVGQNYGCFFRVAHPWKHDGRQTRADENGALGRQLRRTDYVHGHLSPG